MSDYISRKALGIGKCNPDVFEDKGYAKGWNDCIDIIQNAPAADVRPVVYCRECIHWKKSELVICGNYDMVCDYHIGARYCRHADDFCSKGERRADDG